MSRLDPQNTRQAAKGTPVLKILIAALVLCVIAFIGLGFYGWSMPDQTLTNASATATPAPSSTPASGGAPATSAPTAK